MPIAEVSQDTSAPVPKCSGHFGTGAEVSWGQSVLEPKCLVNQVGMGSNGHDVVGTDISSDWTSCSVTASKCDRTGTLRGCITGCGDEAVDCRIVAILSRKKLVLACRVPNEGLRHTAAVCLGLANRHTAVVCLSPALGTWPPCV